MTNVKVLTGWDNLKTIYLLHKKDGQKKVARIHGFEWYFIISTKDYKRVPNDVWARYTAQNVLLRVDVGKKFVKIFCDKSKITQTLVGRQLKRVSKVEHLFDELKGINVVLFEADLSLCKRYMTDERTEIETDLSILFFDIETESSYGITIGRDRIISWAAQDEEGKIYFEVGDEKELLAKFLSTIEQYDIISGWNSGKFDLPYIQERMRIHGIEYDWRKNIHIDLMKRCIKLYHYDMDKIGLKGFSLNEVSRVFLNERKIEIKEKPDVLYKKDFELFKKYNIRDVTLLYKLNDKLKIINLMKHECNLTGTFLTRFYVGELLDNYMLRESKKFDTYLTTRPNAQEIVANQMIGIIGGYVKEPEIGLYDNVRIFDYKSLYPSIIIGWNIGQDSLAEKVSKQGDIAFQSFIGNARKVEDLEINEWFEFLEKEKKRLDPEDVYYQTSNNNFFKQAKLSFMSILIKNLLEQKDMYKAQMVKLDVGSPEYARAQADRWMVKELANSMYGVNADRRSRYFNKNIAESITITGQFLNKLSEMYLTEMGHAVIYGDTDSVFSVIHDDTEVETICERVNSRMKAKLIEFFRLVDIVVELEYDKKYKKMILLDKKRYTGLITWMNNSKVEVLFSRGTEDARKNSIAITKESVIRLILMITKENQTLEYIKEWLSTLKNRILTETMRAEELTISTKLSKPTYKYKSLPIHVKLAKKLIESNQMLEPSEETHSWVNIQYIITNSVGGLDAVLASDFDGKWDRMYYWNVQIYTPLKRILNVVYPNEHWAAYLMDTSVHPGQKVLF